MEAVEDVGTLRELRGLLGAAEVVGLTLVTLLVIWGSHFRGGYSWRGDLSAQFNWHPLLMALGMVFLYGNSIMVYRAFRTARKPRLKLVHAGIHLTAFFVAVVGLQAVFDTHNLADPPIPNMYTLHSWLGLTSVAFFAGQWLSGLVTFLLPGLPGPIRASIMPVHVFAGVAGFVLAVASALMGLLEKAHWAIKDYKDFASEGILVNMIGVVMVLFAVLVVYIVTTPAYKRSPLPENEVLLTGNIQ